MKSIAKIALPIAVPLLITSVWLQPQTTSRAEPTPKLEKRVLTTRILQAPVITEPAQDALLGSEFVVRGMAQPNSEIEVTVTANYNGKRDPLVVKVKSDSAGQWQTPSIKTWKPAGATRATFEFSARQLNAASIASANKVITARAPRDYSRITVEKSSAVLVSEAFKDHSAIPFSKRLRITYPPKNVGVPRGTGLVVNGTASSDKEHLIVVSFDGIRNTYVQGPANIWVKTVSQNFHDKNNRRGYRALPKKDQNGEYIWTTTERVDTSSWEVLSAQNQKMEFVPNRVRITAHELNRENGADPRKKSQTVTVDIKTPA